MLRNNHLKQNLKRTVDSNFGRAKIDFYEYLEVVTDALETAKEGCTAPLQEALRYTAHVRFHVSSSVYALLLKTSEILKTKVLSHPQAFMVSPKSRFCLKCVTFELNNTV